MKAFEFLPQFFRFSVLLILLFQFIKISPTTVEANNLQQQATAKGHDKAEAIIPSKKHLKILVYAWTSAYSHLKFQTAIADALADAGHEVVNV